MTLDLWNPHFRYIYEGGRLSHGEADEEDGSIWVGEGSQCVVFLPPTCVPELKMVGFFGEWNCFDVVVKDDRDIVVGEFITTISYEQRSFPHSSITNDRKFD